MLDKSIPYYNIIMRYDGPKLFNKPVLPVGFSFSSFRHGDEQRWAQMEVENNDFDTYENGVKYFRNKYLNNLKKLQERFIGVCDYRGNLCGAVICWDDERDGNLVSTVHWLITDSDVQKLGIGKALAKMLVYKFSCLNLLPIYLHTQPWSYLAVGIYSEIGFKLMRNDSFRGYHNQSVEALVVLETLMPKDKFFKLVNEMI